MVARKVAPNRKEGDDALDSAHFESQLDRVIRLLALLAVKGDERNEKILTLSAAGFSPSEIAALLRTTPNAVSIVLHRKKRSASNSETR